MNRGGPRCGHDEHHIHNNKKNLLFTSNVHFSSKIYQKSRNFQILSESSKGQGMRQKKRKSKHNLIAVFAPNLRGYNLFFLSQHN
jgi:hypothetical protein